jgi:histidine ammonia-lyase
MSTTKPTQHVDGNSLELENLVKFSTGKFSLDLTPEAWGRVAASRQIVQNILDSGEVAYGINTGFGLFSKVVIDADKLEILQDNLIRSHSAGVGPPLSRARTRMLLALRINVLSKGHSGISTESLQRVIAAFNADCISVVPSQGTVGASGDLAPLSHLALGLMGEGPMWDPTTGEIGKASDIMKRFKCVPIKLKAKEGLAMINGTQMIASLGSEACCRAENATICADIAVAMSLEALKGTAKAFHPRIHESRPHVGQNLVATRLRALLCPGQPSEIYKNHRYTGKVQDAYTLRCAPQVHGIAHDTIQFVKGLLRVELNSATDNPMVFTGDIGDEWLEITEDSNSSSNGATRSSDAASSSAAPSSSSSSSSSSSEGTAATPVHAPIDSIQDLKNAKDEIVRLRSLLGENANKHNTVGGQATAGGRQWSTHKTAEDLAYQAGGGFVISGGNFHGEYPAKALDYLAIGVSELAAISERRIERLCNPQLSELPAFLVQDGGLCSGFMIAHCTAASLVSENKVLVHPASCDSLSTSGAKEDHVSMGGFAARKALNVVENVEHVLAIEILCACQAIEFFRPLKTTPPLEAVHALVRKHVEPWDTDRHMSPSIDACVQLIRSGEMARAIAPFMGKNQIPTNKRPSSSASGSDGKKQRTA